jgi:hypothetical protein
MKQLGAFGAAVTLALFAATSANAQCGLCDTEVVINSELATCFLSEFPALADRDGEAVAVDLSGCGTSRGVVEALPEPSLGIDTPDTQFMLSRSHLTCLKQKLEEPGIVLDPTAKIELKDCG